MAKKKKDPDKPTRRALGLIFGSPTPKKVRRATENISQKAEDNLRRRGKTTQAGKVRKSLEKQQETWKKEDKKWSELLKKWLGMDSGPKATVRDQLLPGSDMPVPARSGDLSESPADSRAHEPVTTTELPAESPGEQQAGVVDPLPPREDTLSSLKPMTFTKPTAAPAPPDGQSLGTGKPTRQSAVGRRAGLPSSTAPAKPAAAQVRDGATGKRPGTASAPVVGERA